MTGRITSTEVQLQFPGTGAPEANGHAQAPHPTPARAPIEPLLTAEEVAGVLRVPRSTIYELARRQAIPYLKVGRRTLFDPDVLTAWIASRMVWPRT